MGISKDGQGRQLWKTKKVAEKLRVMGNFDVILPITYKVQLMWN